MVTSQLSPTEREALCARLEPVMHFAAAVRRGASSFPLLTRTQEDFGGGLSWAVGEAIGVDWKSEASVDANRDKVLALVCDLVQHLITAIKNEAQHVG